VVGSAAAPCSPTSLPGFSGLPNGRALSVAVEGARVADQGHLDLDALLAAIAQAAPGELPALLGQLEHARAAAWARLTTPPAASEPRGSSNGDGHLLDVAEAAAALGVSTKYLYREVRAHRLPFARRIGRRLRFDPAGMQRWVSRRPAG
jgi:excisionase family DNA binding protein